MATSDFAPWLKNRTIPDAALTQLRAFADAHAAQWPYHSNRMADYVRVVQAANDPNEDVLLTTLERYFLIWTKSRDGWLEVITEFALLATGLIVVLFIFWALFRTDLITVLSDASRARGLITFLFAFITIAVVFVVVIAVLWMGKDEDIDGRFNKAKDVITILVGILGTIIGFYFGNTRQEPAPVAGPPSSIQSPSPTVTPPGAAAPPSTPGAPQGTSTMPVPGAPSSPATGAPPAASTVPSDNPPPAGAPAPPANPPPNTTNATPDTPPATTTPGTPR